MQFTVKFISCVQIVFLTFNVLGGQTLLERARQLYTIEEYCSDDVIEMKYGGEEYSRLFLDMRDNAGSEDALATESYIVSVITSFRVDIPTNYVGNCNVRSILQDRGRVASHIIGVLSRLDGNEQSCRKMFQYFGELRNGITDDYVVKMMYELLPDVDYDSIRSLDCNPKWLKVNRNARTIARSVVGYRGKLMWECGKMIYYLKDKMPTERFDNFTNDLVSTSMATKYEQGQMFSRLKRKN